MLNRILKPVKYIFFLSIFFSLCSCNGNEKQQHPDVKNHEEVVLKFWKNNSPVILDFFLEYEALNKAWSKTLDESPTKGNTQATIDTIVKTLELENLKNTLNSPDLMFYEVHVGPTNGYSSDLIFPKKYANSNYENYLKGLTYGVIEFHRKDISLDLMAFDDPNIKTNSKTGYNSIKVNMSSEQGECEIYFRLKEE